MDFDFLEQDAIEFDMVKDIETDYYTRIEENNWTYSKYFKKFYSTNETMDCHINNGEILDKNLHFKINIHLEDSKDTKDEIIKDYYLTKCHEWIACDLIITNDCINNMYKIKFDYENINKIKKCIENIKTKKYDRIYLNYDKARLHLWYKEKDLIKLAVIEENASYYQDIMENKEILSLIIDGNKFIKGTIKAIDEFKTELEKYKDKTK